MSMSERQSLLVNAPDRFSKRRLLHLQTAAQRSRFDAARLQNRLPDRRRAAAKETIEPAASEMCFWSMPLILEETRQNFGASTQ